MNVRHFGALVALGALVVLAGCGGGGSGGPPIFNFPKVNLDRVGTWSGREVDSGSGEAGPMTLTIGADRSIRGTWQPNTLIQWRISGTMDAITVSPTYNAALEFDVAGQPLLDGSGNIAVDVTTGHLGGNVFLSKPDPSSPFRTRVFTFNLDLVRQ